MTRPAAVRTTRYESWGKRLFDVLIASAALLVVLPVMGLVAIVILARLGAPICFREWRAGKNGRPFVLWKFRTMTNDVDGHGRLLPDQDRLTPLGRFLRRTSIDELPELVNVLRGDMSLVGPRPLPVRYLERYTREQARRHEVRPGLTGLTQIRGRNALSWEQKFALDVQYVDHRSLLLDLKLLAATFIVVLTGKGISHPGHATMEEFSGSLT